MTHSDARTQFADILARARNEFGLSDNEIANLPTVERLASSPGRKRRTTVLLFLGIILPVLAIAMEAKYKLIDWPKVVNITLGLELSKQQCLLDNFEGISDTMRPYVNCDVCRNITAIEAVYNITQEEFMSRFAYTSRPVLIKNATTGWTAHKTFSFDFFKELYPPESPVLENTERDCQFFPYRTSFENLGQVFNISEERRSGTEGEPWYIGWSNCDSDVSNRLRKHYTKPYFLGDSTETSKTDWIFMGSPGYGAHLHIDAVEKPSWQAQIRGQKQWILEPPPECYFECPSSRISAIMITGDIIVVDTTRWFHETHILGDEISITIGSEYD
eukprot:m.24540 g.24540  ORF g.24540 m.24540 type:complete len:331 (+) comp28638_c0_seq3:15-1007(+)